MKAILILFTVYLVMSCTIKNVTVNTETKTQNVCGMGFECTLEQSQLDTLFKGQEDGAR